MLRLGYLVKSPNKTNLSPTSLDFYETGYNLFNYYLDNKTCKFSLLSFIVFFLNFLVFSIWYYTKA